jgi:hypothetical protein
MVRVCRGTEDVHQGSSGGQQLKERSHEDDKQRLNVVGSAGVAIARPGTLT